LACPAWFLLDVREFKVKTFPPVALLPQPAGLLICVKHRSATVSIPAGDRVLPLCPGHVPGLGQSIWPTLAPSPRQLRSCRGGHTLPPQPVDDWKAVLGSKMPWS